MRWRSRAYWWLLNRTKTGGTVTAGVRTVRGVTYLSPLGYLLGIEGVALLRGFREGSADRGFIEARIAEIRTLVDTPALTHAEGRTPRSPETPCYGSPKNGGRAPARTS